jgi:MoaA/NifB/PqqE/SkfB family radical SAM enzyme
MIGGFQDSLNLISGLTPKRLTNSAKVLSSYYFSRMIGRPAMRGLPISIAIEPTTSCNLRCPECPSGLRAFTRPTGMLSEALFQKVIDELAPTLSYLTFYFQGEPYLNAGFLNMVSYAVAKGIYTATSTNAHYLNESQARNTVASGLHRLIISIDGTTQEAYEAYRVGGTLTKVLEGARNVIKAREDLRLRTPHIAFQFLVVRQNEHQIADLYKIAKDVGVDQVLLKTAQIYDYEKGSDLMPLNGKYSRYKKNASGSYEIKNELLDHCWRMWQSCVVTWDGRVIPCCFDKDAHHVLGNVHSGSFRDIWFSDAYNDFRRNLMVSRKEIDMRERKSGPRLDVFRAAVGSY